MTEQLVPVFRVKDVHESQPFYEKMGFRVTGTHQFEPDFPIYMFLERRGVALHLSEHRGDAPKRSLAYFYVHDVQAMADALGVAVEMAPWGPETSFVDPDGNTIRFGRAESAPESDGHGNDDGED